MSFERTPVSPQTSFLVPKTMGCALLLSLVATVITLEVLLGCITEKSQFASAQYPVYQRRYYYNQRPYSHSLYSSGSEPVRTFVSGSGTSDDGGVRPVVEVAQKVRLDVYYATDCPDSMRFITRQLYPLYREMGDVLDIHLVPYGKADERYNSDTNKYEYICQHGSSECYGNTVQSCVKSLYPDRKDYMPFINCMEEYPRPSQNGHKCARRVSLDWQKIDKCAKGDEGNRLQHEEATLTQSLEPRLYFVPWIVVDKVFTTANQRMALRDLKSVVCSTYKGSHPKCLR